MHASLQSPLYALLPSLPQEESVMTFDEDANIPESVQCIANAQHFGDLFWVQRQFLSPVQWFVFDAGLICWWGWPFCFVQHIHSWADVQELHCDLRHGIASDPRHEDGVITPITRIVALKFRDGSACRIILIDHTGVPSKQVYFNHPYSIIANRICQKVAEAQLPLFRSRLEAGQEVSFGRLSATSVGLRGLYTERIVPWGALRAVETTSYNTAPHTLVGVVYIYTYWERLELPEHTFYNVPTLKLLVKTLRQ